MEQKIHPVIENMSAIPADVLNPFVHKIELNTYDKFKVALMTVTIFPIRFLFAAIFLGTAWILACVGLNGMSGGDLDGKPITGWRSDLKKIICFFMRALFVAGGFNWITVKGKQASPKEAPVLALAPHSSYFDALPVIFLGAPSVVAKGEIEQTPVLGKLINYTQPVYVWREDPNSRQNTIKNIQRRATSEDNWHQVAIFPEGTCTNRTSLIQFKPGAFYPGVPVQPVCIKYPNRLDTITWTWEGPGPWRSVWLSLCQFHNFLEIEFLPVHVPSPEEIKDPKLFAENVRQKMADALGLQVADYSYDDCRLMSKAAQKNLPYERGLVEIQKLRSKLGLELRGVEDELSKYAKIASGADGLVTVEDFAAYLGLPVSGPLKELFFLYDTEGTGKIDFRQYLIGLSVIAKPANTEETIQIAFKLFDRHGKGHINKEDLNMLLKHALNMTTLETDRLFNQVDVHGKGCITYDEFRSYARKKPEYAKIFTLNRLKWLNNEKRNFVVSDDGDNNSKLKKE
uniref:EF-hand domain-containing protein n=1 Tax=Strigamia maritima TaxID=126957 RepID=T1J518_STRMM